MKRKSKEIYPSINNSRAKNKCEMTTLHNILFSLINHDIGNSHNYN